MYSKYARFVTLMVVMIMVFSMTVPAVAQSADAKESNNVSSSVPVSHSAAADPEICTSGIRTLSNFGDRVYPDQGNAFCFQVEDHSFWFQHRNACILAVMSRLPPGGVLFAIGGGNGFVARALVAAGLPAVVVEPGPQCPFPRSRSRHLFDARRCGICRRSVAGGRPLRRAGTHR